MNRAVGVLLLLSGFALAPSSVFSQTTAPVAVGPAVPAGPECVPLVSNRIEGFYSIGLGNTDPFRDVITPMVDLSNNYVWQACNNDFKDRTEMHVIYNVVGAPEKSVRVERKSCFVFEAAKVKIRGVMGGGHNPPEDGVSGTFKLCKLP